MFRERIKELTLKIWWKLLRNHTKRLIKEIAKLISLIIAGVIKFIIIPICRGIYFSLRWIWLNILAVIDHFPRACVAILLLALTLVSIAFYTNGRAKEETLSHQVDSLRYLNDHIQEFSRYEEGFADGLLEADTMK